PVHRPTIERFDALTHRDTKWTEPENIVTNGPYQMVSWIPDVEIRAVKNPHYWNARSVSIDEVNFIPYGGKMMTLERSFRLGKLHMAVDLPISKIEVYKRDHPELLNIHDYLGCYFYRFNVTRPPFTDARVRRAFAMAINSNRIVTEVTRGGERPARNLVPPDTAGYTCKTTIPYDVEAARQLLAEAGFPGGKGLPDVDLLYNTSESHQLIAESIQHMLQEALGARVVLRNQDAKVYFDSMKQLDYGMCRSAWVGDYLDPINFLECFETDGGNNRTGWASDDFDRLLSEARLSPSAQSRDDLYQQAEGLLMAEAPIAPVYFYTQRLLKRLEVQGWKPNIQAHIDYKYLRLVPVKE
ncbi:MAG: peptide ABC transporter substrate-binding protein, partial [Anaerolineae bacterium]|nr:peptide ABC transporter substrate-binding protein [Anaerolineae bacterium]